MLRRVSLLTALIYVKLCCLLRHRAGRHIPEDYRYFYIRLCCYNGLQNCVFCLKVYLIAI